jgi:cytoskeletal protein CcmA (bactofilin family)
MALWKDQIKPNPAAGEPMAPSRFDAMTAPTSEHKLESAPTQQTTPVHAPVHAPAREKAKSESLIAPDIAIEGKIEGAGHVRIAGRFKGDVNVNGDLTIESRATVTGSVRAETVIVSGELIGNIDSATHVELAQGGALTGDLKAGSLIVAAGSRMRGHADFGWDDVATKKNNGAEHGTKT